VSARARAVHLYFRGGPLCGTYVTCSALYAIDDDGRDVPEAVTCRRCLGLLGARGGQS
jgi:hypothetical protein